MLSGLTLATLSLSGCAQIAEALWPRTPHAAVRAKAKPRRLDARGTYLRMQEIQDGVRIVVASEHRRLRRAKSGASAPVRHRALIDALTNLEPVLRKTELRLRALEPVPKSVQPLLALRLQRVRKSRATLHAGLSAVRRGEQRNFGGWQDEVGRETQAEGVLRGKLGLGPLRQTSRRHVASAFDGRGDHRATPFAITIRRTPSRTRFADPLGPSAGRVAADRAFVLYAGRLIPLMKSHDGSLDGFIVAMQSAMAEDPARRDELGRAWISAAMDKDDALLRAITACGRPIGEERAYVEAIRRQFGASRARLKSLLASGVDMDEFAFQTQAYVHSPERWRLTETVRLASEGVNARLRFISLSGTTAPEDWANLKG